MEPNKDLSGTTLSERYQLVKRVGEGAMGSVYQAKHTFMHKDVAVKMLHPQLLDNPEVVERFQREAQAAAHIDHPNVCTATDFGKFGENSFFLVMEWLDGKALDEILAERDLDIPSALHIAKQIALALEKAHELGIVHRDLKPANIMIVARENDPLFVKVTDFGVARVRLGVDATKLTQAGMTYGTPSYMAPEQAAGEEIDHRADIYALGIVLFEMVTGRVPFTGGSVAQILAAHVTEPPPLPSKVSHQAIPPELEQLILSCLSKTPENRPASARSLAEALIKIDTPRETSITPGPPSNQQETVALSSTSKAPELQKALRDPRILGVVGALAVAAVFVFVSIGSLTGKVLSDQVDSIRQSTLAEERAKFVQEPDVAAALQAQASGDISRAIEGLNGARLNHEENPHFHFLLGSALVQDGRYKDAVESFSRAVELEPLYSEDSAVRLVMIEAFNAGEDAAKASAAYLQKNWSDEAKTELMKLVDSERKILERTQKTMKGSGIWEKLSRAEQLQFELRSTRKCKELETLVAEARKESREEMLPSFRYLDGLPKRGCGFLGRNDCYSCIRPQLSEVLGND